MTKRKVVLLPGDGIGREITDAVVAIFEKAAIPIDWVECEAGLTVAEREPSGVEEATLDLIREHGIALKGPTTTPSGGGHRSVNVHLRKKLGLFANVRPIRPLPGITIPFSDINLVTIRENIEDTYGGQEYLQSPDVAKTLKVLSRVGSQDIIRFAFEYARNQKRSKITCVHKANIHKLSDGLFLEVFDEIKQEYPDIESTDLLVDNVCMQLVTRPAQFDVMVMPNLYGDILSDLCAGLIGGLGVAPSANIGAQIAVFEAVHGSAPDIAGKNLANPAALLRSSLMMLSHLGFENARNGIEFGLNEVLQGGKSTKDLGGSLSTSEFVDAICSNITPLQSVGVNVESFTYTPRPTTSQAQEFTGVQGVDVFFRRTEGEPLLPVQIAGFHRDALSNRGAHYDAQSFPLTRSDVYCARYRGQGNVSDEHITKLLEELSRSGVEWISCQKLYLSNGRSTYSEIR